MKLQKAMAIMNVIVPRPITLSREVAKKPDPSMPGGASNYIDVTHDINKKGSFLIKNEHTNLQYFRKDYT